MVRNVIFYIYLVAVPWCTTLNRINLISVPNIEFHLL